MLINMDIKKRAQEIIKIEAEALGDLANKINANFVKAVKIILNGQGRVIITGMGKPGIIGKKIAATLASTGTPALFLHPAEAVHGDLGMILQEDIVIAISNSGETEEMIKIIPLIKKIGCQLIAMTGNLVSTLAKNSDLVLDVSVEEEACSLGLAPTASTTAALAMGDALAIVLLDKKGFKTQDYAFLHPGGELGKKLLIKVKDVMRKGGKNSIIEINKTLLEAVNKITHKKSGAVTVVDDNGKLKGIFTDGDLRRVYVKYQDKNIAKLKIKDVMTKAPVFLNQDKLAVDALSIMQAKKIDELPVVDDNGIIAGMLDVQDLLTCLCKNG
jgi:arabinose-5-phosphate isomerase